VVATTEALTLALSQREKEQSGTPGFWVNPKWIRLEGSPYYSLSLWERAGVRAPRVHFSPATIP
jgi:hypothetical protein